MTVLLSVSILVMVLVVATGVAAASVERDDDPGVNRLMTTMPRTHLRTNVFDAPDVDEDETSVPRNQHRVLNGTTTSSEEDHPDVEFIIGGTVLDRKVWGKSRRYLAALTFTKPDGTPFHSCGATLISRRVLLSAAHCFTSLDSMDFEPPATIELNLYSYDAVTEAVSIPICPNEGGKGDCLTDSAYAVRHEDYNDVTLEHDFALIVLPNTKQVNKGVIAKIDPVILNSDAAIPSDGEMLEVFGWGSTTPPPVLSKPMIPSALSMKYLPNIPCQEQLGESRDITGSMLCAVGNGTTSAFKGDSGGPVITLSSKSSKSVQVGVISSFADEDNDPRDSPNVFARVSDGFAWITSTVCKEIPDDRLFCDGGGAKASKKHRTGSSLPPKVRSEASKL